MALTSAERQKRYRKRRDSDPDRKEVAREKARKRWHESVADGKVKLVKDLSEREKRSRRRSWREVTAQFVILRTSWRDRLPSCICTKKDGSDTKINQNHDMWSHKIVRGLKLVYCWDAITFPRKSNVYYSFTMYWLQISESIMLIQKIKERKLHSKDWFVGKLSNGKGLIPCYQNQLVFLWREQV